MAAERVEQLRKAALFSGLKTAALELIAKVASEESHTSGTKIFQHGDAGDKLYLILEGRVRISREVPGMGEEALAVLGPGEVFGEMALLDESPRSADAHPSSIFPRSSARRAFRTFSCSARSLRPSRMTSLADVYMPEASLCRTNFSSSGVSETFMP